MNVWLQILEVDVKKKKKFVYIYWLNQMTGKLLSHIQNQRESLRGK